MFPVRWEAGFQLDAANFALGGGNLLILLIGFYQPSRTGWQISLVLVGITSFWAWHANLKRYRTVADTPTSRIASAPQGYIEIVDRDHFDMRLSDGIHLIRKPLHGQAFLIANREVTLLVRHFRLWSWAHLALMLTALLGLILIAR